MKDRTVILGVTGGIAAYKAADLASKLVQAGATVKVIMTESATKFVTPLTFRNLTGQPVVTDMWELDSEYSLEHVALAEIADVIVIAPATANIIARMAAGIADDSLTCIVLATEAPVVIAPSMNDNMYKNSVTQENIAKLKERGFVSVEPETGRLASGKIGQGRLADIGKILDAVQLALEKGR
jgi:phosphopantothenoylcysteine decarboxylase/phosphopantothenate--cysteine ligase